MIHELHDMVQQKKIALPVILQQAFHKESVVARLGGSHLPQARNADCEIHPVKREQVS